MQIDENDYVTDDQIDAIYDEHSALVAAARGDALGTPAASAPVTEVVAAPIYPMPVQQAQAEPLLARKVAGVPIWAIGLGAIALGGGAWWYMNQRKEVTPNGDGNATPEPPPSDDKRWSPSRSGFGDVLKRHFQRRGIVDKAHIYTDADEAKKKLKQVSPLITIKVDGGYKPDKDMDKLCRREGLQPIVHEDGTIGLYPTVSKRGREWEEYIDALREDGQTV